MSIRKSTRSHSYQAAERLRNTARLLSLLRGDGRRSRIDLSREMGVDRSTVTGIASELLEIGVVQETGIRPAKSQTAGRPAVLLALRHEFGVVAGIEFHLKEYRLSLVDIAGTVVHRESGGSAYPGQPFSACCRQLLAKADAVALSHSVRVLGAVIGVSAAVDPIRQLIVRSFVYELENFDFRSEVSGRSPYPVIVENDANCCAAGEISEDRRNILYLLARTTALDPRLGRESGIGLGMGIVSDGRLHYGSHYASGELRSARWLSSTPGQLSLPEEALADVGSDAVAFRQFVEEVSYNLSPLISAFDPDCLVLGGDLRDRLPEVGQVIETTWKERYVYLAWRNGLFRAPTSGIYEVADGAARLLLLLLFDQETGDPMPDERLRWDRLFAGAS